MTDPESRLARVEEHVKELDEWRRACAMLPVTVSELLIWKKEQNSDIRELAKDVRQLRDDYIARKGIEKMLKWGIGVVGVTGIVTFINMIIKLLQVG